MNPYGFVRVDWSRAPERHRALPHDRFAGLNGRLEADMEALTPLFLPGRDAAGRPLRGGGDALLFSRSVPYCSPANPEGCFIAGSSLKGLIRSVVETVAQGCFWHARPAHPCAENLPEAFRPCQPTQRGQLPGEAPLCPACRLFGLISTRRFGQESVTAHRLGNVGFEDAVCTASVSHTAIYTAILSNPKPLHSAFYVDAGRVAGRKFFYHHLDNLLTASGWLPPNAGPGFRQNQRIHPLGAGSRFSFAVEFTNVEEGDFAALLYALVLETGIWHKLGYAKPCGLGSVAIRPTRLALRDPAARYREGAGTAVYEGPALQAELQRRLQPFAQTIPKVTRGDLGRIWRWPPAEGARYVYPDRDWFNKNSQAPLEATP